MYLPCILLENFSLGSPQKVSSNDTDSLGYRCDYEVKVSFSGNLTHYFGDVAWSLAFCVWQNPTVESTSNSSLLMPRICLFRVSPLSLSLWNVSCAEDPQTTHFQGGGGLQRVVCPMLTQQRTKDFMHTIPG